MQCKGRINKVINGYAVLIWLLAGYIAGRYSRGQEESDFWTMGIQKDYVTDFYNDNAFGFYIADGKCKNIRPLLIEQLCPMPLRQCLVVYLKALCANVSETLPTL